MARYRIDLSMLPDRPNFTADVICSSDLEACSAAYKLLKRGGRATISEGDRIVAKMHCTLPTESVDPLDAASAERVSCGLTPAVTPTDDDASTVDHIDNLIASIEGIREVMRESRLSANQIAALLARKPH